MSFGYGYMIANSFLDARASAGDGWKKAVEQIADVLVNPAILQMTPVDDMDVFGRTSPQLTPGMNSMYNNRSLEDNASVFRSVA